MGSASCEVGLEGVHVWRHAVNAAEHEGQEDGDHEREEMRAGAADQAIVGCWDHVLGAAVHDHGGPGAAVVAHCQVAVGVKRDDNQVKGS